MKTIPINQNSNGAREGKYAGADPGLQLRADCDAAPGRLNRAVEEMMRILDGNRIVKVSVAGFFAGGVETEEQLDAALKGLRETCTFGPELRKRLDFRRMGHRRELVQIYRRIFERRTTWVITIVSWQCSQPSFTNT